MYLIFESVMYHAPSDPLNFSYRAVHPFAAEFEEQMTALICEYKSDGEFLSVHHPDMPEALGDAPDATTFCLMGAARGVVGDNYFM